MKWAYELQEVSFSYDHTPILNIPELQIRKGELLAVVGPNGAGKTTLLHLLAFLEAPTEGEIAFFGESTERSKFITLRRRVGLLLQNPYLFRTSVLANMIWGLRIRGISRYMSRNLAEQALQSVGLHGFEDRRAHSLSGGESQRVALARALVLDPDVLLLDEPTNHMDEESAERIIDIVVQMNRDKGRTVIFSSHDPSERKRMVPDRTITLRNGLVVEQAI
jgi:tungstate transport system ATP-binding protein